MDGGVGAAADEGLGGRGAAGTEGGAAVRSGGNSKNAGPATRGRGARDRSRGWVAAQARRRRRIAPITAAPSMPSEAGSGTTVATVVRVRTGSVLVPAASAMLTS